MVVDGGGRQQKQHKETGRGSSRSDNGEQHDLTSTTRSDDAHSFPDDVPRLPIGDPGWSEPSD
jgi:hypothetical protein